MFANRTDAGKQLLARLPSLPPDETVVMALPRGGVPVAEVITKAIGAPMDVIFVRKVGLPHQPEVAVAAVTDGTDPKLSINRDVARHSGLSEEDIRALADPELAEIARRRALWHLGRAPLSVTGKTVLVVDDGIATGATMRAALDCLSSEAPAKVIVMVPVAARDALAAIEAMADQVICLDVPRPFFSVGTYFDDFRQVSDDEVTEALARQGV